MTLNQKSGFHAVVGDKIIVTDIGHKHAGKHGVVKEVSTLVPGILIVELDEGPTQAPTRARLRRLHCAVTTEETNK